MVEKRKIRTENRESRKRILIATLEEYGTVRKACEVTGISRKTYDLWQKSDPEFSQSMDLARRSFAESLEEIALDRVRNPEKGKGSDVLLLGLLNANMPHKFRPQLALNEDSAKELIVEWRKAAKEVKKDKPAQEEAAVLNEDVEKTLAEILEKKGTAPKKTEDSVE
tara:strand:+ start:66 stop:566 length:501 start_codon:yes stop_codon:yes gene_type:complete